MPRPRKVDDEALIARLTDVFRATGYDGASLARLSEATGLRRASLYHRFPGGKEQMAREVLTHAKVWLDENVVRPLRGDGSPERRSHRFTSTISAFYSGGRQACLLNLLSAPSADDGMFVPLIRRTFRDLIAAAAALYQDLGCENPAARAERAVALLQGSLVLARGTGSTRPFRRFLAEFEAEIAEAARRAKSRA